MPQTQITERNKGDSKMKKLKSYTIGVYTAYSKVYHLCGLKDGMRKIVIKGCTKKDAMQRAGIKWKTNYEKKLKWKSLSNLNVKYAAILKGSKNVGAAKDFVEFLSSSQAKAVLKKYGFILP